MFVQLIQFETTRFEEGEAARREMIAKVEGRSTVRRSWIARDRDNPNRYVAAVEFESYEDAMRNSELPEIQEFSAKVEEMTDGTQTFTNLDVIDVQERSHA